MRIRTKEEFMRLVELIGIYSNLDLEVIEQIYELNGTYYASKKKWGKLGRKITIDGEEIKIPIFAYNYRKKGEKQLLTYKDISRDEIRIGLKNGSIEKVRITKGYRLLEVYNVVSTYGRNFDYTKFILDKKLLYEAIRNKNTNFDGDIVSYMIRNSGIKSANSDILAQVLDEFIYGNSVRISIDWESRWESLATDVLAILRYGAEIYSKSNIIDIKDEFREQDVNSLLCDMEANMTRVMISGGN